MLIKTIEIGYFERVIRTSEAKVVVQYAHNSRKLETPFTPVLKRALVCNISVINMGSSYRHYTKEIQEMGQKVLRNDTSKFYQN